MNFLRVGVSLTVLLCAPTVCAQPSTISLIEHAFGASPVHMVAGHGRLTAGVTREGDIAVLAWPGASCCDQLTHLASNAIDARSRPRTGVRDGFGISLGLRVHTSAGTRVVWLHDATVFTITAGYTDDRALEPVVTYESTSLGLRVIVRDAVLPDTDVMQRAVRVERLPMSASIDVALMTHANLGLTQNRVPRLPFGDVVADGRNDFGLVWDAVNTAALHFRPGDRDRVQDIVPLLSPPMFTPSYFGPLDSLMRESLEPMALAARVAGIVRDIDTIFVPGVYAYVATEPAAEAFEMGREDSAFCDSLGSLIDNIVSLGASGLTLPIQPSVAENFRCNAMILPEAVARARGWTRALPTAWSDAQDGDLQGNPVAAWLNDSAQRTALVFDSAGVATARVFIAFGSTARQARESLTAGRALTTDGFIARDHVAWEARTMTLAVPDRLSETIGSDDRARVTLAARRAILHVYNGTDARSGAIVASIARQAPYGLDWPRDGAFFDYALDVAGNPGAVTKRLDWVLPLARQRPIGVTQINPLTDPRPPIDPRNGLRQYPEDAWEMNYYDDGTMGGFYRFEIDNTALMVWSAAVHPAWMPLPDRRAWAESHWDQLRRSTELLASWRDDTTGLNAPANEDDNAAFTATLHGGVTVFTALEAAARLARFLGHTGDAVRWEHRAAELRDALVRAFYDPSLGVFVNNVSGATETNPGSASLGATAWAVWPARLLPINDPRLARQVRSDLERVLASLRGTDRSEGGSYLTKTTLSAAMYVALGGDQSVKPLLQEAMTRLANDVIDRDTQVMGEVFVTLRNPDGSVRARENRVAVPHLWEATLYYLSAMAMSAPERFELDRSVYPMNETPGPGVVSLPTHDGGVGTVIDGGAVARTPNGEAGDCGCRTVGDTHSSRVSLWLLAVAFVCCRRRRGDSTHTA